MPFRRKQYTVLGQTPWMKSHSKDLCGQGRPSDNPLIVHIARLEDLYEVAEHVPEKAETLATKFWPGPLTMIFEKTSIVPMEQREGWRQLPFVCRMMRLQEH